MDPSQYISIMLLRVNVADVIVDDSNFFVRNFGSRVEHQVPFFLITRMGSFDRCAVVIDVREQYEWDAGHVSCASRLQIQKRLRRTWQLFTTDDTFSFSQEPKQLERGENVFS